MLPLQAEGKREAGDMPHPAHSAGVSLEMYLSVVLFFGDRKGRSGLGDGKLKIMGDKKEEKLQSTDEREKAIDEVTLLLLGLAAS